MKFKPADVAPPDLDMTPMIDIVFQLITFFMVINKFDQAEADERVTLPKDQLAVPQHGDSAELCAVSMAQCVVPRQGDLAELSALRREEVAMPRRGYSAELLALPEREDLPELQAMQEQVLRPVPMGQPDSANLQN